MMHLVIAIRGWTSSGDWLLFGKHGSEIPSATLAILQSSLPNTEVWAPPLDLSMFCMRSPEQVAEDLFATVDAYVKERETQLASITLLGFSAGSLLARRLFCRAHGAGESGEIENEAASWASKIQRLVILAGITRGWEFSTASPAHVRFFAPVLLGLLRFVGGIRGLGAPFIAQLQRGSPFVVSTRLQYLRVMERLRRAASEEMQPGVLTDHGIPSTVFLLGAKDEYVSPADCTELGMRSEFVYIELPGANHADALFIEGDDTNTRKRRERLLAALSEPVSSLRLESWAVPPADIDDYLDPMDLVGNYERSREGSTRIDHVVMIIHGIRDNGFWTKRVAREVKATARTLGMVVRAPTPTYGYFSMWDFIKPGGRERAARWFMECYADVRGHFPEASVSFVGHSNGTYIAARALELCPAIHLDRVVLAGSVLRCGFEWSRLKGTANHVLNFVGRNDSVVAFLPGVFEKMGLRFMDVGGAGAFGFDNAHSSLSNGKTVNLSEVRYVDGGHGAAIGEDYWPAIAKFALTGEVPHVDGAPREGWLKMLYRAAPVVTIVLGTIVVLLMLAPLIAVTWVSIGQGLSPDAQREAVVAVVVGIVVSWLAWRILRLW